MSQISITDPARFYQDSPFPGRRLIAWAIGIWAVCFFLPAIILNPDSIPPWVDLVQNIVVLPIILLYFIGFWRAVAGKGYPRVMFLMSLVPFLGLVILFYLPKREELSVQNRESEQGGVSYD